MKERIGFLYNEEEDLEWILALRIKDSSLRILAEFDGLQQLPLTQLTHELKLYSSRWSPNCQRIYVLRNHGAYKQIYAINVKTGEPSQITNAPLNIENYTLSPNGSKFVWIGQDAQTTRIIRVSSKDGHEVGRHLP